MEVFEVINNILSDKKMTKREFAQKLIALAPRSNRTGEIISENIIYSYLEWADSDKGLSYSLYIRCTWVARTVFV